MSFLAALAAADLAIALDVPYVAPARKPQFGDVACTRFKGQEYRGVLTGDGDQPDRLVPLPGATWGFRFGDRIWVGYDFPILWNHTLGCWFAPCDKD